MSNQDPAPSAKGFWTSATGVITGVAGLLTAIATLYGVTQLGNGDTQADNNRPIEINLPDSSESAPDVPGQISFGQLDSSAFSEFSSAPLDSSLETALNSCSAGDPVSCAVVLDTLVAECAQGYGLSCDWVYALSPVGSEYELFGATCGYRYTADFAGTCSQT